MRLILVVMFLSYLAEAIVPATAGVVPAAASSEDSKLFPTNFDPPSIQLTQEGDQISVIFSGTLESAAEVGGPWTEETHAVSPFRPDVTSARRFFRTRGLVAEGGIFSGRSVVDWVVTGPLQTHFDLAFAGVPDGIIPPRREKPYFHGSLQMAEFGLLVSLRVRGNSSLQECPFPKLKLKISKEQRKDTPFAEAREIKIGTHCAEGGRGTIGRLRDERATYREALAYEAMELLGFTAPRVRRARIEFQDSSPADGASPGGWKVTRQAVILEDVEVVAERLGGRALDETEIAALRDAGFAEQLITELRFFHILLGNWDYKLSLDGQGLWNTDVIQLADGRLIPMAGDFDLASWVTERPLVSAPRDYHPELPEIDRRARYELGLIKKQVKPEIFEVAHNRFAAKRDVIESLIQGAEIDENGRTNSLAHVTSFFEALNATGN